MHSALLFLQHIQILMKTINFLISYDNFCMCTKHFASHCIFEAYLLFAYTHAMNFQVNILVFMMQFCESVEL